MRFSEAYGTKNNKECAMQKHSASNLDILRDSICIPSELLLSRARFRFQKSVAKLNLSMYIYKLS